MTIEITIVLLIVHGLVSIALLGAITHQAVAAWRVSDKPAMSSGSFMSRYGRVAAPVFVCAVIVLYVIVFVLGAVIYPEYRLDARLAFEEMRLWWAVGAFELKEHWGGIGLALLPLYGLSWGLWREDAVAKGQARWITTLLALVVWYNLVIGHVLNNIRGLG